MSGFVRCGDETQNLSGHDGRRGFIHHMAVTEEYRYQGIASNLLEHALSALEAFDYFRDQEVVAE